MNLIAFIREYSEAAEDRKEEQKRLEADIAKRKASMKMRRKRY